MKDRIKQIRKDANLTQEEFSKTIHISRSNLGNIESGKINLTDRVVNDICDAFRVNPIWLRTGNGNPYIEPKTFSLDEYAKSQDLHDNEINLIRGFMELDPNVRSALYNMFRKAFNDETQQEIVATLPSHETSLVNDTEALEDEYKKSVLRKVSNKELFVSNITADTKKQA